MEKVREDGRPRERLFDRCSELSLRSDLREVLLQLGIDATFYVFHSLRHGAAAHDFHTASRSFDEIKARGRWKEEENVRLYIQRAKQWLVMEGLPAGAMRLIAFVGSHACHGELFGCPSVKTRFAGVI